MALKTRAISFVWGLAEATFFFFVPDIWLTRIAVTDLKEAVVNVFFALIGAVIGGVVLYVFGSIFFETLRQLLDYVPAISERLIERAGDQMQEHYPLQVIIKAGFTGVPFKLYAVWSGHLAVSFPLFLVVSILARGGRFIALVLIAYSFRRAFKSFMNIKQLLWVHLGLWVLFYCLYFIMMGF